MRDLSLHLLDLIENSVRAGARTVRLTIREDPQRGVFSFVVEDDGTGLKALPPQALEPHYTTKDRKSAGMGLTLFRDTAGNAGGGVVAGASSLGGTAVIGMFQLGSISPEDLGDIPATLEAIVCTEPALTLTVRLISTTGTTVLSQVEVEEEMRSAQLNAVSVAREFARRVQAGLGVFSIVRRTTPGFLPGNNVYRNKGACRD